MQDIECVVVGAGVVGLAIAAALSRSGRDVAILEAEAAIGTGTSARNSEVIHAGLYYPPGLLKTRLCMEGRAALYDFCRRFRVPHRRIGKLLVATGEAEIARLAAIKAQGEANGTTDLAWIDPDEAKALEPALSCVAAVLSPSTGIIDSHALMMALWGEAEDHGAVTALRTPVLSGRAENGRIVLMTGGDEPMALAAQVVVNAAGFGAQALARSIAGMPDESIPPLHLAKGNYFTLAARPPFSRLIYPMPEGGGLGVHLTLDLGGRARFGPDVEWIDTPDYRVDPGRAAAFYPAIRRYWPGLPEGALMPDYAGIRPKIDRPGGSATDFMIQGPESHGIAGLVNLFGIESPGLTASLAIARYVAERL